MKTPFLLAIVILSGCVGPAFVPYVGVQRDWKRSDGAFVKTVSGVQIYPRGCFPSRRYQILGSIVAFNDYQLATEAKAHHADAVVVFRVQMINGGSVTVGGESTTSVYGNLAITQVSPRFTRPIRDAIISGFAVAYLPD